MSKRISLPDLSNHVQKLIEEHQHHTSALERIEQILASVGKALGAKIKKLPLYKEVKAAAADPSPVVTHKRRRRRRRFETSAEESILEFVRANKNPTTQDIKKMWLDAGRGGRPDQMLSALTKAKKLKRTPLGKGIRGSRYSVG